jgi:hypothetical protein
MRRATHRARLLLATVLIALVPVGSPAQESTPSEAPVQTGRAIRGRVLGDGGKPVASATVALRRMGSRSTSVTAKPDADGSFRVEGVEPGTYDVYAYAPAYIADDDVGPTTARPGDDVTVRLVRGGVITGRVTNADGEAVVMIPVRAKRIRDGRGRPHPSPDFEGETATDDRGEYRLYGLAAGTYLVLAGGKSDVAYNPSIYTFDAPTYHPSATSDTALPVAVHHGQEVTGVDIRYRSLRGHRISGRIERPAGGERGFATVRLVSQDGTDVAHEQANPTGLGTWNFQLEGVPDGEYLLWGGLSDENIPVAGSTTQRITVRGADVTDLSLTVVSFGAVSGIVALESGELPEACARTPSRVVADTAITVRRDTKGEPDAARAQTGYSLGIDEKGAFIQRGIRPGKYWLVPAVPPDLYVKSVTFDGPSPAPAARARVTPLEAIAVAPGRTVTGIRLVIARGAATVSGMVELGERRLDGQRVFVHLVPSEVGQEGATWRYYEVEASADGAFTLESLAPGRYWVVVDLESAGDALRDTRRAAWQASERRRLRGAGASQKLEVELVPCQKVRDVRVELR